MHPEFRSLLTRAARHGVALWVMMAVFFPSARLAAKDAVEQLQAFSLFSEVDLPKLIQGEVLTERGPLTDFRRGISGQSCYVARRSPAAVAERIQTSAPLVDNDHVYFHAKIGSPVREADLAGLALNLRNSDVQRLVERTMKVTAASTDFCMSRGEATRMEAAVREGKGAGAEPSAIAKQAWSALLMERIREFQQNGLQAVSPYDMEKQPISPSEEMRRLMREEPEVQARFQGLLEEVGLFPSKTETRLKGAGYAELLNAQIVATFDLGAVFVKPLSNGEIQVLDVQYFSSNAYYVMLTLYHLWPISTEGGEATLVWRGDFLSAYLLEATRGTPRMAWGLVMMREIKQSIQSFQKSILSNSPR